MTSARVSVEQLEAVIRQMPDAFTILDFAKAFAERFPKVWQALVERYGFYGSGTRYSALTYLSNRLSSYSKRKTPGLLKPTPVGWKPEGGRYLRRTTREERQRFGSPWIAVYRRQEDRCHPLQKCVAP
ncbi:MAG TPA: hypothetical protein EYP49_11955 [Anaerolineae bacterium]|nr:hypothetical protein [Anaerolineae bacterium]